MKHQQSDVHSVFLFPSTSRATAVRTSVNLDTAGADYATVVVNICAELNTNASGPALSFKESDDTVASNFATWDADLNRTIDNTADVVAVSNIDLKGRKRYVNMTVTPGTTTNDTVTVSAIGILNKDSRGAAATNQIVSP